MFILIAIPLLFGLINSEALEKFKHDQDAGATWHFVGESEKDPKAKSIALNGKIYFKLKGK